MGFLQRIFGTDTPPVEEPTGAEEPGQHQQDVMPRLPDLAYKGGLTNPLTGAGTVQDKTKGFYYQQRYWSEEQLDAIVDNSWAARKVVNIPVDDCFNRFRIWDDSGNEEFKDYERKMKVRQLMRALMITGRKYGTALGVIITKDDETNRPLIVENIEEGDLIDVVILSRFSAQVEKYYEDPFADETAEEGKYGHPKSYRITFPHGSRNLVVHHTRILRFDGIARESLSNITIHDEEWGIPVVQPLIDAIIAEDATAGAAAHLVQEASVKIVKMGDVKALKAIGKIQSLKSKLEEINIFKSIYRMFVIPHDAEYERQSYNFGGIKDLLDRQIIRIAAGEDIPVTRFSGRSPAGLDATGESDDKNYAKKIVGEQLKIRTLLDRFDSIALRSFGIIIIDGKLPGYTFPSIIDQSDSEIAEAERKKAEALKVAQVELGAMEPTESRYRLSGGPIFGDLEGEAPGLPEPILPAGGASGEPTGTGEE